jgi:hypothetical protein
MYGRNVVAVIATLLPSGVLALDPSDEVHQNIVVCTDGEVVNVAIRAALGLASTPAESDGGKVLAS